MSILIKNAQIIGAAENFTGDIFIQGESISAVGKNLDIKADKIIDATGMLAFPGCIDPHVHLEMPFMGTFSSDNYETGTRAALHGGTTTVIDFILQKQGNSLYDAFNEWSGRADGNAVGDYSFHMAVTDFNENGPDQRYAPADSGHGLADDANIGQSRAEDSKTACRQYLYMGRYDRHRLVYSRQLEPHRCAGSWRHGHYQQWRHR